MKNFIRTTLPILIALCFFCGANLAQNKTRRKPAPKTDALAQKTVSHSESVPAAPASEDEKTMFETAQSETNPFQRIERLKEFLAKFPRTILKTRALEAIIAARADYADELMRTGDPAGGKEQFRLAIKDAPATMSDKLFTSVLSRIPANLFFRGERETGLDAAKKVEEKAGNNADRLLAVAQFYIAIENGDEARRLAAKATQVQPDSANAQITLGIAHRINFRLEDSAQAFRRAAELDPKSVAARRGLADALRGLGQADEAAKLYREILAENSTDEAARNGLILALFGAGNRAAAETEMESALAANPKNFQLLATAAYWYAANGESRKAVELGQKAVEIEPRYTWAHIALARGLMLENKPLAAERALLIAKQYGDFPTLDYELANARYAAGFYEDAAADLRRAFRLNNGAVETNLAGKIKRDAAGFVELLAPERRAAILQPVAADTPANAERLKKLLALADVLNAEKKDETAIVKAANDFVAGDDAARAHRGIYAASRLLNERIALNEVLELSQVAAQGIDAAAGVPAPSAAVLADELYEPRRIALQRGEIVNVPEIQPNVLNGILRGRIEELAGWALYNQDRADEAVIRLKRAVGILPANSAWWRSSQWRLGAALEKAGKDREAVEAYAKSYRNAGANDANRRAIIENLYVKIYGSTKGLEAKLSETAQTTAQYPAASIAKSDEAFKNPLPEVIREINQPKQPETARTEPAKPAAPAVSAVIESTPRTTPARIEKPASTEPASEKAKPEIAAAKIANSAIDAVQPQKAPEAKTQTPVAVFEEATKTQSAPQPVSPAAAEKSGITNAAVNPAPTVSSPRVIVVDNFKNLPSETSAATARKINKIDERPRIVAQTGKTAGNTNANANAAAGECVIWSSQDAVSLLSAGGKVALLVGREGLKSPDELIVTVSNPAHLTVSADKDVSVSDNRALFEIRSTSEFRGEYTVTFESGCGKKMVKVRVR